MRWSTLVQVSIDVVDDVSGAPFCAFGETPALLINADKRRACQGLFDLRRCAQQHSMITEIELDIRPLAHHRCVKTLIAQLGGRSDRQPSEADVLDAIPRLVEDAQDRNPRLTDRGRAFRYRCFARDLH